MMKRLLSVGCAAVLSLLLLIQASAAALEALRNNRTIYLTDSEAKAVGQAVARDSGHSLKAFGATLDVSTVMPIYKASLFDFAESGAFTFERSGDGQQYVADTLGGAGTFAGVAVFTVDGGFPAVQMVAPTTDKAKAVDFGANAGRISALLEQKAFDAKDFTAKFAYIDGMGYVYFLSNASEAVVISVGLKGDNPSIFDLESGGIVAVDDALMAKAELELEAYQRQLDYLATLKPGENPATGGGAPAPSREQGLPAAVPTCLGLLWGLAFALM